jgi:hypothetical protein
MPDRLDHRPQREHAMNKHRRAARRPPGPARRSIFLLLLALLPALPALPAFAADDGGGGGGGGLGRLFFTPERRQSLDRQRQLNLQNVQASEEQTLTINGVVLRSSGKRTAWINGVAQNENDTASGIAVTPQRRNPGRLTVRPGESAATDARVGETINRSTGEASSLLDDGRIVVHRR